MVKIEKFWNKFFDAIESEATLELEEIIYSKKHGHEICVMHLVGKNIFPKMTTEEILSNSKARAGLNKDDLITITRLDMEIQLKKNKLHLAEYDRNGTIVIENTQRERQRYSEIEIAANTEILNKLNGTEGYKIGYNIGLKEAKTIFAQKSSSRGRLRKIFGLKNK